jgi:hypothetical protein
MQSLQKTGKNQLQEAPKFAHIVTDEMALMAYKNAIAAGCDYAQKALICGQILIEMRSEMTPFSHDEKTGKFAAKKDGFVKRLEELFGEKSVATLYRWIGAAERVNKALGLSEGQWALGNGEVIDIDAQPMSAILTLPEAELAEPARKARQMFFDFTADKTIADCLRDVADGTSPDHRIARAANGKTKGGTRGEDRKAWDEFIRRKLRNIDEHVSHYEKFSGKQIENLEKDLKISVSKWPTAVLDYLGDEIKEELKKR